MGDHIQQTDNLRVVKPLVQPKIKADINYLAKLTPKALLYDADKVRYYKDLLNFYNNNFFGAGLVGTQLNYNPATEEGQRKIQSAIDYAKSNVNNFAFNVVAPVAVNKVINAPSRIYSKFTKGVFPNKGGYLGTLNHYTKNGVIGQGAEAVVIKNTPTTVGKITTIPPEEMELRNAIPHVVPSKYVGYAKAYGEKMPVYVLLKMQIIGDKWFPHFAKRLDKAMESSGFRRILDPTVLYRAYTNGNIVVDDISPGNIGISWNLKPKIIDFNMLSVPEWLDEGFTLKRGGKLKH